MEMREKKEHAKESFVIFGEIDNFCHHCRSLWNDVVLWSVIKTKSGCEHLLAK